MKSARDFVDLKRMVSASAIVSVALLLGVSGCATVPAPPVEQMAISRSAAQPLNRCRHRQTSPMPPPLKCS